MLTCIMPSSALFRTANVFFPACLCRNVEVEYKYAVISEDGNVELWQEGPNISLVLSPKPTADPKPQQSNLKVFDSWLQPQHSQHVLAVQVQVQSTTVQVPEPQATAKDQAEQQQWQQQQQLQVQAAGAASNRPPAEEHHHQQGVDSPGAPLRQEDQQHQAPLQRPQQQVVSVGSGSNSSNHSPEPIAARRSSGTRGKQDGRNSVADRISGSGGGSMSTTAINSKSTAANWTDAANLLAKVAAAASSAAAAAGSSLAAATATGAAVSATSASTTDPSSSGSSSSSSSSSSHLSSSANDTGAAAAGKAVAQLLTALAANMREGAASNRQPEATSSSSSGTAAFGVTFSEEAVSQASAAVVKGWRGLLAAAAKAQRRAKIAARNSSYPANSTAFGAAKAAGGAAGAAAAASKTLPAVPAAGSSSAGSTAVASLQDTSDAATAAAASRNDRLQTAQTPVEAKPLPRSAQQQQQQQGQQEVSKSAAATAGNAGQQASMRLPAGSAAASAQHLPLTDALKAGKQQRKHTAGQASKQASATALAADRQQQPQHKVDEGVINHLELQQQQQLGVSDDAGSQHEQDHLLLADCNTDALPQDEQQQQHEILAQVMFALEHSASLRQEAGDPCDPGLLAADRRLAAATDVFRSLSNSPEPESLQEQQQQREQLQEVSA
jgi:hypothetical protein